MKKRHLGTLFLAGLFVLTGCKGGPGHTGNETNTSQTNKIDYVHNSNVRLTYDYKGKDFYKDGIGQMDLKMVIDGDTAHFFPKVRTTSDEPVKSRYYGVDTPESTGKIQPYGHAASEFNKEKLKNAAENGTIVVSTPNGLTSEQIANGANPYVLPQADSTGSRYVSLIWINETKKDADYSELVLLNLWLVQDGYSWVKAVGDIPEYQQTFYDAENQAKELKLNLFSGEVDPWMPTGEHQMADLLDMKIEMERLILDPSSDYAYDNTLLRVRGTVAGFANQTLYLATYFSPEECAEKGRDKPQGEWAGINVYVGPAAIAPRFTQRNAVVELCGTMGYSENFGVQLSGVNFPTTTLKNKDTDARVIIKPEENTEEYALDVWTFNSTELNTFVRNNDLSAFNTAINVGTLDQDGDVIFEELECTEFYKPSGSTNITLTMKNCSFKIYVPFTYKPFKESGDDVTIWKNSEDFVGKKFKVNGVFAIHQGKSSNGRYYFDYQVIPSTSADLIVVE